MLTNFLQKPFGAVAILAAAIGGPYAAFETETGSSLRKSLLGNPGTQPQGNQQTDSYSLSMLQGSNGFPSTSPGGGTMPNTRESLSYGIPSIPPGYPTSTGVPSSGAPSAGVPSAGVSPTYQPYGMSSPMGGPSQPNYYGAGIPLNQGTVSPNQATQPNQVIYGEATITPLGPPMSSGNMSSQANMPGQALPYNPYNIETRQGPSNAVPGGTNQLWDYTLGVPSLQQMQRQPTQVGGGEVHDLREVLRFDITPIWLTQRFSRVTTVLSNVQLDGMRVPLITGTRPTDLAGTLTYYFDGRQSLRRVNLHGLMGDPSQLTALMVQFYGFQPEQTLGGQLFTTRWNNRISNVLHLSPAPIVYSGADHSKFIVFLELNQAGDNFGLSPEASEILQNLQANRRW
jgi:hypothetical protein